ncbi:transcriptional activator of glycolytic enzymes-domain-containing protein [Hypoxylon argillaceum]|nr:transcriptional activator of glycolytic enzymes-domain-containing protein [Hypoxylon argillaceum]
MLPQLLSTSQVTTSSNSSSIAPPSTAAAPTTAPTPIATTTPTATTTATATTTVAATTTTTTSIPATAATPTTTTITPPTSTATPAPGPAALTGAIALKRPAASDLQRIAGTSATPSKRRATGSSNYGVRSVPNPPTSARDPGRFDSPAFSHIQAPVFQPLPVMPAPAALITEDQLHGRTPEQLIATILQLQHQHQQFLMQINAQYESINQQLSDLRGGLIASHQAAASALGSRDQPVRSAIPPPPVPPQQTAVPPPPRPPMQTPTRANVRVPPASPSHPIAPRSSVSAATPTAAGPPQYDYRTVATVEEVWKEYREGMDGQPAIEKLDAVWGSRWRPEPRGRTWYSRRKVIWDKIKEFMAEGMDEDSAVQEVEQLRDGGTINKLIRMLQDDRKDKGIGDEGGLG